MRVVAVVSGKGGVGKTTTVANIGASLASEFKRDVVLMDGNFTTPNLGYHLGMYNLAPTMQDVLKGRATVNQATHLHPCGLKIIPSALPSDNVAFGKDSLKNILQEVDAGFILIDCPPGIEEEVVPILEVSDEILIVTNPEMPALTDALVTMKTAERIGVPARRIELNRARKEKYALSVSEIERICEMQIAAIIPESAEVRKSISAGRPVVLFSTYSPPAIAFKTLAATLAGVKYSASFIERLKWHLGFGRGKLSRDEEALMTQIQPLKKKIVDNAKSEKVEELNKLLTTLEKHYKSGMISQKVYEELRKVNEEKIKRLR
jgi:septum site-determining protein MinD